jgi:alkylation response protein AidB-like acyl-CoA dehydrogenase
VHRATRLATVVVCAELLGGMQWVLESTVEYAKTREQFGRVIGAFQAVQHHCADMLYAVESARSAVYSAAWAVSVDDAGADEAVSVAKAYCSDAARTVGNLGVQVHGGIGFTWEHDLNLFYRRSKADEIMFGDARYHRERLAEMLLDGSEMPATEVTDG